MNSTGPKTSLARRSEVIDSPGQQESDNLGPKTIVSGQGTKADPANHSHIVRSNTTVSGQLLRAVDVSGITGLSIETLAQWRSQRRGIPFVKLSRNRVAYRQADLDAWIQERIVPIQTDQESARRGA